MDFPFVPITMRDFFFHDPYFRRNWFEFDDVFDTASYLMPTDPWRSFEEDFRNMTSNMLLRQMLEQPTVFKPPLEREVPLEKERRGREEPVKETEQKGEELTEEKPSTEMVETGMERPRRTLFPRRWMLPTMRSEFDKLGLFQEEDTHLIRQKMDEGFMEVTLDTSNYRPDELKVFQAGDMLTVEGKHEERSPDGNRYNYRQFQRRFKLPEGVKEVSSNLSTDGVLVIHAGQPNMIQQKEKTTEEEEEKK